MIKGIENLPERIKKHIIDTVKLENRPDENRIWVTEVLYCLRKAYFRRKIPKEITVDKAWHVYRGIVMHEKWESLYDDKDKKIEIPIYKTGACLVGKYDFIDDGILYDLKWVVDAYERFLVGKGACESHVNQIKLYMYYKGLKRGRLIYLMSRVIKVVDVELDENYKPDEFIIRALILWDALKENRPPPKSPYKYECKYCEYKDECIKVDNS